MAQTHSNLAPANVGLPGEFDEEWEEEFDDEDDFVLRWSWRYVSLCLLIPALGGYINGYCWAGLALHYQEMGWSIARMGTASVIGFIARIFCQKIQVRYGFWVSIPLNLGHLGAAILGVVFSDQEWAVILEVAALRCLDAAITNEGLAFEAFGRTEALARQASATVLALFTISCALAVPIGGALYDNVGKWRAMSLSHLVCQALLVILFIGEPAVRLSVVEFFTGTNETRRSSIGSSSSEGSKASAHDPVLASVVPVEQPSLPGQVETEMIPETEQDVGGSTTRPRTDSDESKGSTSHRAHCPITDSAESKGSTPSTSHRAGRPRESTKPSRLTSSDGAGRRPQGNRLSCGDGARPKRGSRLSIPGGVEGSRLSMSRMPVRGSALVYQGRGSMRASIARGSMSAGARGSMSAGARGSMSAGARGSMRTGARGSMRAGRASRFSRASIGSNESGQSRGTIITRISRMSRKSAATGRTALTRLANLQDNQNFQFSAAAVNNLEARVAPRNGTAAQKLLPEEEGAEEEDVCKDIPKDLRLPAFMISLCCFNTTVCYVIELGTFVLLFKDYHQWDSALGIGLGQCAGDLTAAFFMKILPGMSPPDEVEEVSFRQRIFMQPYDLSWLVFFWIFCNLGMASPWLVVAVISQVLMGSLFVYNAKFTTDLNLFYSLGDNGVFMTLQVWSKNAHALGGCISSMLGPVIYSEVSPVAPFFVATSVSVVTFLTFTVYFAWRVGLTEVELAETRRARRLGLKRVSTWQMPRATTRSVLPAAEAIDEDEEDDD